MDLCDSICFGTARRGTPRQIGHVGDVSLIVIAPEYFN